MILPAQRRAATTAIHRFGENCEIEKPSGTSTNGYGKETETGWTTITDGSGNPVVEPVVAVYTRSGSHELERVTGGRYLMDSPLLLYKHDSVIQKGYRVVFPDGTTYEVDDPNKYPTHYEAETTVVS